ncbi:hypothetical protein D3C73_1028950 [compost metagenome]
MYGIHTAAIGGDIPEILHIIAVECFPSISGTGLPDFQRRLARVAHIDCLDLIGLRVLAVIDDDS